MSGSGCPYSNLFGAPGTGAHSVRFFGFAVVDVALTVLAAWCTAVFFDVTFWLALLGWFIAGVVLHRAFCVRTTIDKLLFSDR